MGFSVVGDWFVAHGWGWLSHGPYEERLNNDNPLLSQRGLEGDLGRVASRSRKMWLLTLLKSPTKQETLVRSLQSLRLFTELISGASVLEEDRNLASL